MNRSNLNLHHMRSGRLAETRAGIKAPNYVLQVLGALLIGLFVFSWFMFILYAMTTYAQVAWAFKITYFLTSIALASFVALKFATHARQLQSVERMANSILRPR